MLVRFIAYQVRSSHLFFQPNFSHSPSLVVARDLSISHCSRSSTLAAMASSSRHPSPQAQRSHSPITPPPPSPHFPLTFAHTANSLRWNSLYPIYFDSKVSASKGRRVPRERGMWWPQAQHISIACRNLGLQSCLEVGPGTFQ